MGWIPAKKKIANRFNGDTIEEVKPIDQTQLKDIVSDAKRQKFKNDIESMEFKLSSREDK